MAAKGPTEDTTKANQGGESFVVSVNEERPRSAVPKRFRNYQKKTLTKEELEEKQKAAEYRRKEKEQEMIERIHRAQEDANKLNKNFQVLLDADAKLQQSKADGTCSSQQLSKHELKETFRAVNSGYKKMVGSITASTSCPDKSH